MTGNWSGANAAGLGIMQANAVGGFSNESEGRQYGSFVGEIAAFNFYGFALTDAQAREASASVVPEPATLSLLVLGALGLLGRRRRSA